ncbi:FAD-binding oxidoreductase [Burkholderia multivorans]|uniref:FAD-binding oxidoreductase n=1 Tax=Burkholderia multivorans TaxID=87883 RepID=UPI00201A0A07|nr:FAD-binding oxidoreductase [Burkholderia multivorans]MCO1372529.1 FAD-binding oxidoreductase [Burkholderia multivorans]MCO1456228.1 FAD-binding oxidoreductase [Burkholderia multivorans]MCO1465209.1 FAD-binding oxidoreductase [Burkholderia multivorans]UQO17046.1 FAD-binding oxidoreductase [Burkholderia multivorans]UQO85575.1 FAD-binding oxidoreductase [Burkholderia multivorans]
MSMPDTAAARGTLRAARLSDTALEAALVAELGDACVTRAADIEPRYFTAYNERPGVRPRALVRPRSVDEVSRALALCTRLAQPVVPQGGLTGLARGAVALGGEVVLSMERFAGIDALDAAAGTLTVRAGTPLQVVQEAADAAGFTFGVDLGARGSCQIGGMLATNAGGTRAIRYGTMREQVLGLEAVLADGTVVSSMNRMLKNNAGYDLKQLFIGSEGTLGVVTRAVLRLHPKLAAPATALCRVRDYEAVVALWNRMRTLPELVSFEAMWPAFYDYVARHTPGVAAPFAADGGFAVLIECATSAPGRDARAALETALADAIDAGLADDAALATSERQARDLWTLREGLAIDALPNLVNFDVSLPTGDLGAFAARCDAALRARWPDIVCLFFGHVGDGNVHIGVSLAAMTDADADEIDRRTYAIVRQMGGSVSAEHGIGVLKRDYLAHTRSDSEIALMRTLKAALDPGGILNPGKVL